MVYICSTSIPAQPVGTPDPLQASRPTRHKIAEWRKSLFGIPCPLPIKTWALWLATLATSLQVAFGGVAQTGQAFERWNLPIAGVAVQINRVQYFSLSALVREGRPDVCNGYTMLRLISDWEGELGILRELVVLHAHNARWRF